MNITTAVANIPTHATAITVETWEYGNDIKSIIWDRTGLEPEDGEWGDQLDTFTTDDTDDVDHALREWEPVEDWVAVSLPEDDETFRPFTRTL